jgi:hypothetical protein
VADRQDREPVGSVAEETARLLEALGDWAEDLASDHARGASQSGYAAGAPREADPRCAHCGADSRMGEAMTCRLCPLCQGIAVLRAVRPETVDRLADLAGALSSTLRDLAAESRSGEGAQQPPARGHRVHDICVEDEDAAGADTADAGGAPGDSNRARPGSAAT